MTHKALVLASILGLGACSVGPSDRILMPEGLAGAECPIITERLLAAEQKAAQVNEAVSAGMAGTNAAAIGMSLLIPFSGFAMVPVQEELSVSAGQANSDVWAWKAAKINRECES